MRIFVTALCGGCQGRGFVRYGRNCPGCHGKGRCRVVHRLDDSMLPTQDEVRRYRSGRALTVMAEYAARTGAPARVLHGVWGDLESFLSLNEITID